MQAEKREIEQELRAARTGGIPIAGPILYPVGPLPWGAGGETDFSCRHMLLGRTNHWRDAARVESDPTAGRYGGNNVEKPASSRQITDADDN